MLFLRDIIENLYIDMFTTIFKNANHFLKTWKDVI